MSNKLFKFQQGGFLNYTPLVDTHKKQRQAADVRQERYAQKAAAAAAKEAPAMGLDPEIFKKIADNGITSDVYALESAVNNKMMEYSNMDDFEKSTFRGRKLISDLTSGMIPELNKLKRDSKLFEEARAQANENNSYREHAMTSNGELLTIDNEGNVGSLTINQLQEAKENGSFGRDFRALTVSEAIDLREHQMPGANILIDAVGASVGETQVYDFIDSQLKDIGETVVTRTGTTINTILENAPDTLKEVSQSGNQEQVKAALNKIKQTLSSQPGFLAKMRKDAVLNGTTVDQMLFNYTKQLITSTDSMTEYTPEEKAKMRGGALGTKDNADIGEHQAAINGLQGVKEFTFGKKLLISVYGSDLANSSTMTNGMNFQELAGTKLMHMTAGDENAYTINGQPVNVNDVIIQRGGSSKVVKYFPIDADGKPDGDAYKKMQEDKKAINAIETKTGIKLSKEEKAKEYAKLGYNMDKNGNPVPMRYAAVTIVEAMINDDLVDLHKDMYKRAGETQAAYYNDKGTPDLGWFEHAIITPMFFKIDPDKARFADNKDLVDSQAFEFTNARTSEILQDKRDEKLSKDTDKVAQYLKNQGN